MSSQLIEQLHQNSSAYWIHHKIHEDGNCRCFVHHVKGAQEMLSKEMKGIKYREKCSPWLVQNFC